MKYSRLIKKHVKNHYCFFVANGLSRWYVRGKWVWTNAQPLGYNGMHAELVDNDRNCIFTTESFACTTGG